MAPVRDVVTGDSPLPTEDDLDLHRNDLLQGTWQADGTLWQTAGRCWSVAKDLEVDPNLQFRCRFILLFLFGILGHEHPLRPLLPEHSCEEWVFLSMPDRVLRTLDLEMMQRFYRPGQEYELGIPRGREVWIVGAFSSGPEELGQILQWTPSRIHMFEPVVEFFEKLKLQWRGHEHGQLVHLHNYGLGEARERGEMFMASVGSSLFQPMEFSATRLFLDSVSDFKHGRLREHRTHVRVEAVELVWRILSTESLGLLHMNCEGCEYEVIPQLAAAGLLHKIEVIFVASHLVLNDTEAAELCDAASSGTCSYDAAMVGGQRFCDSFEEVLAETHARVWGLPFSWQYWELKAMEKTHLLAPERVCFVCGLLKSEVDADLV